MTSSFCKSFCNHFSLWAEITAALCSYDSSSSNISPFSSATHQNSQEWTEETTLLIFYVVSFFVNIGVCSRKKKKIFTSIWNPCRRRWTQFCHCRIQFSPYLYPKFRNACYWSFQKRAFFCDWLPSRFPPCDHLPDHTISAGLSTVFAYIRTRWSRFYFVAIKECEIQTGTFVHNILIIYNTVFDGFRPLRVHLFHHNFFIETEQKSEIRTKMQFYFDVPNRIVRVDTLTGFSKFINRTTIDWWTLGQ